MLYEFWTNVMVQTVRITFFVLSMMVVLEWLNVYTQGHVHGFMQKHSHLQVFISSILGILPGCVGSFTAVSLYTHDVIGFGALVANLIATIGDEAFYLFSLLRADSFIVLGILLALSLAVGYMVNLFSKKQKSQLGQDGHFVLHPHHDSFHVSVWGNAKDCIRNITPRRIISIVSIMLFIVLSLCGLLEEHEDLPISSADDESCDPLDMIFVVVALVSLFVVITVPTHFLDDHIWHHVIGKHFGKVCFWCFVALLFIFIIHNVVDINAWVSSFSQGQIYWMCVLAAILIGLIPESGPHLVFITLYAGHVIPFGALLANCIVQDGHGAVPLFAESKKDFFAVKGIKVAIALVLSIVFWFWS